MQNESGSVNISGPLDMCGGACVCKAPPSAWILIFSLTRDVFWVGSGSIFLLANDIAQVRLRVDKT